MLALACLLACLIRTTHFLCTEARASREGGIARLKEINPPGTLATWLSGVTRKGEISVGSEMRHALSLFCVGACTWLGPAGDRQTGGGR